MELYANKLTGKAEQSVIFRYAAIPNGTGSVLTEMARDESAERILPDLEDFCNRLHATFMAHGAPYSALQFVPVMKRFDGFADEDAALVLDHPETSHVLVHTDLLKVVLIHWPAGKISSIHGHPEGGCVFKVLRGNLVEKRFTAGESNIQLSVSRYRAGSMAYIDDRLGYHSVGNLSDEPAISIHAYTPGR